MIQFGMDFMYDNGSAGLWNGSSDLGPMYAAFRKQAAYCAANGFTYANTSATRRQFVNNDIIKKSIEVFAEAGLSTILWLWGGAEYEWNINSREYDPVFSYFEDMIKFLDTMPDLAKTIKVICYAPEFDRIGTAQEAEGYLSWAYPMYRGWLDNTKHMQSVLLSAGMGSARLENAQMQEMAHIIADHTDIFGFSEYPTTDEGVYLETKIWAESYGLLGTPILMQEMNNATRMNAAMPPYAEENYWGHVPYKWLAHWANFGTQIVCLHRGNNSYSEWAKWFDIQGDPLLWFDGLIDDIANRTQEHGYWLVEYTTGWSLGNVIRMQDVFKEMGSYLDNVPAKRTHDRWVPTLLPLSAVLVEGCFDPSVFNTDEMKAYLCFRLGLPAHAMPISITKLGGDGSTWDQSRQAALQYLKTEET